VNSTPAAWDGWNKYMDAVDCTRYEYMLRLGVEIEVLIGAYLTQIGTTDWHVLINVFNPSAGEYIDFEGNFPSFTEAEAVAWAQAQEAIEARKKFLMTGCAAQSITVSPLLAK
jgi:hypothetical protein